MLKKIFTAEKTNSSRAPVVEHCCTALTVELEPQLL